MINTDLPINTDYISSALAAMNKDHQEGIGARNLLQTQQQEKTDALATLRGEIRLLDAEQAVLSHTSRSMMTDLVSRIEEPVSAALQLLWEDDRLFRFRFGEYRGEPAAWREVLKREGTEEDYSAFDPDEQSGGGVSDIVSLILDLSFTQLIDPPPGGIFSRDEPAKQVDRQGGDRKTQNIAFFLKEFVARTGIQFVFITHNDQLEKAGDVVYRVEKIKEMTSRVIRVK
jgi:hypothetical protein